MALPPLASIEAFELWPGVTLSTGDDYARVGALLDHVSAAVRAQARRLWVDEEGELAGVPDEIPGIVVQITARVWANPQGKNQSTTGPFSGSWSPDAAGLRLTDDEKIRVSTAVGGQYRGLGTISTTRGPVETPSGCAPLGLEGDLP